jgi:hypothetical protein
MPLASLTMNLLSVFSTGHGGGKRRFGALDSMRT